MKDTSFTVKSANESETVISGYASVYGCIDCSNDIIVKGAFKEASPHKVRFLWQHNKEKPIGIIRSLKEDDYGLQVEAAVNLEIASGREACSLIKQGAVNGLSVGFSIASYSYDDSGTRIISGCDLMEISVVTFPANKKAGIRKIGKSLDDKSRFFAALDNLNQKIWQMSDRRKNIWSSIKR